MIAAIYARKSTLQEHGDTGDSLSVEEQLAGAKAFITERDMILGPIFKDEAVSGWTVPLEERPGGKALMVAARAKEFDALVLRNETRLGREMADALMSLVALTKLGIRVFYTATGQEVTLRTAKDKLVASIGHFGAEDYAERVSSDTRRGKLKRAREGHWLGPRVFGYRKVETLGPKGERQHVDLVIDPTEAAALRQIFERIGDGWGPRRIARETGKGATTIKHMVYNPLYRGVLRYRGRKDDGSTETVEHMKPELQIIPDALWEKAHARLARSRSVYTGFRRRNGQLEGRAPAPSPHLLGGLMKCGQCGRSLVPIARTKASGRVNRWWACSTHYKLGKKCLNRHLIPYERLERAILSTFERLTPGIVEDMAAHEFDRMLEDVKHLDSQRVSLTEERERLSAELSRLAEGIAVGGELPALLEAMGRKQTRVSEIGAALEHLDGIGPDFRNKLAQYSATLATLAWQSVAGLPAMLRAKDSGRSVLATLLPKPITVTPEFDAAGKCTGWTFAGEAFLGPLLGRLPVSEKRHYTYAPVAWANRSLVYQAFRVEIRGRVAA